ncbi:PepSY domain-containing protein [Nonomuraea ferruginea]
MCRTTPTPRCRGPRNGCRCRPPRTAGTRATTREAGAPCTRARSPWSRRWPPPGLPSGTARSAECDLKILLPKDHEGVYTVVTAPRRDPSAAQTLHVDQYSGRVLVSYGWDEYGVLAKAVEQGVALHEGRRYGTVNLLVMLGACLALITLVVSGAWMWWKRRPKGRMGAPARPMDRRAAYGVTAIMVVLGVLFPLAGVTMLAVLLLDRLVLRRIPRLAEIVG